LNEEHEGLNKEVIDQLEKADWENIILKLGRHSAVRINRLSWRHRMLPVGLEVEDIVLESIGDTLGEERKWDPNKNPDLLNYLKSVVDSKISHLLELKEYLVTEPLEKTINEQEKNLLDTTEVKTDFEGDSAQMFADPEEALVEKEEREHAKNAVELLREKIQGDEELEEIFLCLEEGYTKPSEIAEQLGVDVKEIYNREKRLKRKCNELKQIIMER